MIKKIKGKYVVMSEKTGRKFGTYKTKKEAVKRLQQIEFFKRLKASPTLQKRLKKKVLQTKWLLLVHLLIC
ncbi:hypothetical protein J4448_06755 [Candidatus Woesearchaeota archaeon]|nr:hypothetical protein [Candidatus Woesearchaeota archaeon]